ncbi:MAG: hypothetical protein AB8G95_08260 [Anaerolineae bacterium]
MSKFGTLIASYRRDCRNSKNGGLLSQSLLADLLSEFDPTLIYTKTQISNWEKGKRIIPIDKRSILIGLIYIFSNYGNLSLLDKANMFLQSGGYAALSEEELNRLEGKGIKLASNQSLQTIDGILGSIEKQSRDNEKLRSVLMAVENQRLESITNISGTQRKILETIPYDPTPLDSIFSGIDEKVESVETMRLKEVNLRLHELRYLGLVNRKRDSEHRWLYWRETPRSLFS